MTKLEKLLAEYKKQSEDGLNVHVTSKGVELLVSALRECIEALDKLSMNDTRVIFTMGCDCHEVARECLDKIKNISESK